MLFYKLCILYFYFVVSWRVILRVVERMFTLSVFPASSACTCQYSVCSFFLVILDPHMKNYLDVLILWVTKARILLLDTLLLEGEGEKAV